MSKRTDQMMLLIPEATSMLVIDLRNGLHVRYNDTPVEINLRAAQELLVKLADTAGTPHERSEMTRLLWPDLDETPRVQHLRHAIWRLRKALSASGAPSDDAYIKADHTHVWFDATAPFQLIE